MAPQVSLRGILAYAANLMGQLPLSVDVLPNPLVALETLDLGTSDGISTSMNVPPPLPPLSPPAVDHVGNAIAAAAPYVALSASPSCPLDSPTSCHNSTPVAGDGCCFVYPGGRMVLAQFWDRELPSGGGDGAGEEDWTLHGLWYVGQFVLCSHVPMFPSINIHYAIRHV